MKLAPIIPALVLAAAAAAQPQAYLLGPASEVLQELCLPPCLCPYSSTTGQLSGSFVLEELHWTPVETLYRVGNVKWSAVLNGSPVEILGAGTYTIRNVGPAVQQRLRLEITVGPMAVMTSVDSGFVPMNAMHPFPEICIGASTVNPLCRSETFRLTAAPAGCYANCDGSTVAPILNVADFACFLQHFAAGTEYANCDHSTQAPVVNVADFGCFLQRFSAGCD